MGLEVVIRHVLRREDNALRQQHDAVVLRSSLLTGDERRWPALRRCRWTGCRSYRRPSRCCPRRCKQRGSSPSRPGCRNPHRPQRVQIAVLQVRGHAGRGVQKPVMVMSFAVRPLFSAALHWPGRAVESLQMIHIDVSIRVEDGLANADGLSRILVGVVRIMHRNPSRILFLDVKRRRRRTRSSGQTRTGWRSARRT